jgi:hypothetical protein
MRRYVSATVLPDGCSRQHRERVAFESDRVARPLAEPCDLPRVRQVRPQLRMPWNSTKGRRTSDVGFVLQFAVGLS